MKRLRRHGTLDGVISPKGEKEAWLRQHVTFSGEDCLIFPFRLNHKGRGQFQLGRRHVFASVFMCELAHGARPSERHEAAHSCGKGHEGCVNPRHLRWATLEQNKADMVAHGTVQRGERHAHHRLTEEQVRMLRRLDGTASHRRLAEDLGVSKTAVRSAIRRITWAWLD